ncbi:unnamed protein product [Prorocentrum cordatum]|uniref:Uncharacterized protein n=1 Tax=Prorocentrum cordatum TaxID=2364126 RepID=A0ABN9V927_9DINO|nr:unnamed protein product [Polarella glacialis]
MATSACDASGCGIERPVGAMVTSVFERSVGALNARGLNAKALAFWGRAGAFAWLVLLLCCKVGYRAMVDMHVAGEQELCDAAGLEPDSAECAEARMFRSWQANAAAEELLDFRSLLLDSVAPALEPGLGTAAQGGPSALAQPARPPAKPGQRAPPAAAPAQPAPALAAAAAGPPAVLAAPPAAEAALAPAVEQPTAAPDASRPGPGITRQREGTYVESERYAGGQPRRVLREIAEAMCALCQGPERSGMRECEEFRGVASCVEAGEAGLLDGSVGELAALRADAPQQAGDALGIEAPEAARRAGPVRRAASSTSGPPRLRGGAPGAGYAAEVSTEEAESVGPAAWARASAEGQLPKVACVTAVPDDPEALRSLNITVDSFTAQSYEGEKRVSKVGAQPGTASAAVAQGSQARGSAAVAFGTDDLGLSFYQNPPNVEVSVREFEELTRDRLKVLHVFDRACGYDTRLDAVGELKSKVSKELSETRLSLNYPKATAGDAFLEQKADFMRRDAISHYALRLAFCKTREARDWLVMQEQRLFVLRFEALRPEAQEACLPGFGLECKKVDPLAKTRGDKEEGTQLPDVVLSYSVDPRTSGSLPQGNLLDFLQQATPGGRIWREAGAPPLLDPNFYEMHFTDVSPNLISSRRVVLQDGRAYVPSSALKVILAKKFKEALLAGLDMACVLQPPSFLPPLPPSLKGQRQ